MATVSRISDTTIRVGQQATGAFVPDVERLALVLNAVSLGSVTSVCRLLVKDLDDKVLNSEVLSGTGNKTISIEGIEGSLFLYVECLQGSAVVSVVQESGVEGSGSVETDDIEDGAITADKLGAASVTEDKLDDAAVTTDKLGDASVTYAKLAPDASLAALVAAGLGSSDSYDNTTSGAQTLLAANGMGEGDRTVLIFVRVSETFDDGDNAQTVFIIGETGTTNKFMANTVLVDAVAGSYFVLAGTLTEETALLVTGTPAAGTGTGAIDVTVLALPSAV